MRKLHFITLNYTLNYILHLKISEWTICTLNYNMCYILHTAINFVIILDGTMWKDSIVSLLNSLKIIMKLHFTILNYTSDYTLHHKL